ncbi:IclR family transcriptional regulator [Paraburkholderia guartelaensis]|uniref:IclR family transcriptional regulator n=1 Tax=Paraburkholderia guartelaensis TaxID=2546446 RepID=UPI002AB6FCEB|nr:IclR family transcriptional regulator [Paraburkholderia guartelaensis]
MRSSEPPFDQGDVARFDDDAGKDRQFVIALARGLEVLRCFEPRERYVGLSELARRTRLPKATVARLAGTLAKLGYLRYSESLGKYSLGIGVLALGYSMLSNMDIRDVARPFMQDLAEYARASVAVGVRDRLSVIYVESVRSTAPITVMRGVGVRLPLATTSMGRAYLAAASEDERNEVLEQVRLNGESDWLRIRNGIDQAVKDYKERGFCLSIGDWDKDIAAVGVPFTAPDGTRMAFNCGGPTFVMSRDTLENDIGPRLVDLVRRLGAAVGRR